MRTLERSELVLGGRLGKGGQGTVYAVENTLAAGTWPAVYKEYAHEFAADLDVGALEGIGDAVAALPDDERVWLGERTAWPTELVAHEGRVCGFVMRRVPDTHSFVPLTLTGQPASAPRLAQVELLLNSDDYVARSGLKISERDRFALLADLADLLARLHGLGIAVGDLSPKNLLFEPAGAARCFMIDCDAVAVAGTTVLPQVQTPDWCLPAGEPTGTAQGDAFKFALLAIRLFTRDQTDAAIEPLLAAAPTLGELATLAVMMPPDDRPPPGAWATPLKARLRSASRAPALAGFAPGAGVPPFGAPGFAPVPFQPGLPNPYRPRTGISAKAKALIFAAVFAVIMMIVVAVNLGSSSAVGAGSTAAPYGGGYYPTYSAPGGGPTDVGTTQSATNADAVPQLQAFVQYLNNSVSDRTQIEDAVNGVQACTMDPASGAQTMQQAASDRTQDAQAVGDLDVDAINNGQQLQSDLVSLFNDSASADTDYANWMQSAEGGPCPMDYTDNSDYQQALSDSQLASNDKDTFAAAWAAAIVGTDLPAFTALQL